MRSGRDTSPLALSIVSMPEKAKMERITAAPNEPGSTLPLGRRLAGSTQKAPTPTNSSSGTSFTTVATPAKRAPCFAPRRLIQVTSAITPTISATRCTAGEPIG